jgi:hypothetical protein
MVFVRSPGPLDKIPVHAAGSADGATNTVRLTRTIRWIGTLPVGAAGMQLVARDASGKSLPLSRVLPSANEVTADLRVLEPEVRHELGYVPVTTTPQTDFVGPSLRFRMDELLRAAEEVRENDPSDEGLVWLERIEIVEPPPHDESSGDQGGAAVG